MGVLRACGDATIVLARGNAELASWPLAARCDRLDLAVINDLARLQLEAGRVGYCIRVRNLGRELLGLLDLLGLTEVLTGVPGLWQVRGEAEHGEQGRVDEVVVPDDPVA
jgi:hypothetical protein